MPRGVYTRRPSLINPRKAPAKPAKPTTYTKTCPTCAETFKAKRKDKRFCSDLHRTYYHQDDIPKALRERANELRTERTKRCAENKAKRDAAKANAERVRIEQEAAEKDRLAGIGAKAEKVLEYMKREGLI